ncbi:uncharacterized protein LOC123644104 [Lemur catta]|uniref:uncharacterized protein LOC123644104 n=1 Tax=Lemur catta TaxID=9447 RepID=UPI001E268490|nr:uncharacterized protein LOC123644104 [Lemur catta]
MHLEKPYQLFLCNKVKELELGKQGPAALQCFPSPQSIHSSPFQGPLLAPSPSVVPSATLPGTLWPPGFPLRQTPKLCSQCCSRLPTGLASSHFFWTPFYAPYESTWAAITEDHSLGDLTEIYFLTAVETGSPRSRCQQDWIPLRAVREGPAPGLSPGLAVVEAQLGGDLLEPSSWNVACGICPVWVQVLTCHFPDSSSKEYSISSVWYN